MNTYLLKDVSDNQLINHACNWMANQTETGNGSVSKLDRKESKERMIRHGKDISKLPKEKKLTPHDKEYVDRLRQISDKFKNENMTITGPGHTPNSKLLPLGSGKRKKMIIEIEVTEDFEKRLDSQWMIEREIHADRYSWTLA